MQDYISDRNPTPLFWLFEQEKVPDYVKSASVYDEDSLEGLSDASFAAPLTRRFPVHTKAATFLSAAYYHGKKLDFPEVEERIKAASVSHGVEEDVENVSLLFHTPVVKKASEIKYAFEIDLGNEQGVQRFYPMNNESEILDSAIASSDDYHEGRLPLELYHKAARSLMKEAAHYDLNQDMIPETLRDLGTPRTPDFDHAMVCVNLRKTAANLSDEEYEVYTEVIKSAQHEFETSEAPFEEKDADMVKWAELILDLDRQNGIEKYDGYHLVNPYATLFSGETYESIEKAGSQMLFVGDLMIPVQAIQAVPESEVTHRFNKDASEEILSIQKTASEDVYEANRKLALLEEFDLEELTRLAIKYGD